MKTFSTNTLGCKVNQYESQQVRQLLEQLGLCQVDISDNPDLVVINTCCVTHTASSKSRQYVRKARKLNPNATIVIAGCLSTMHGDEIKNFGDNTHVIKRRQDLALKLSQIVKNQIPAPDSENPQLHQHKTIKTQSDDKIKLKNKLAIQPEFSTLTSFKGQTRAFLKIQDGCDAYCSYCIIPKTRPIVHSKTEEDVLAEAEALVNAGHKEIVITGINLGAYGKSTVRRKRLADRGNEKLAKLIDDLAKIPNMERIRLSSLEPIDVTEQLLDVIYKHPNIMPHIHLSLQSGSDAVLKRMCRRYKVDEFRKTVELIKSRLDRPAITTDLIVGFPGETDADFEATVGLAKETGFAKIHVFSFSSRQGTAAAKMEPLVDNGVIKERSRILHDLDIELGRKFREQFVGQEAKILVENCNGQYKGHSERYFEVFITNNGNEQIKKNDILKVRVLKNRKDGVIGQVL